MIRLQTRSILIAAFSLLVVRDGGDGGGDTVDDSPTVPPSNTPPFAVPGADRTVDRVSIVRLDGTKSYDPDGDLLTYRWSLRSTPTESLACWLI